MLATEKEDVAGFLDLAGDFLGSGYKSEKKEYSFNDDLPQSLNEFSNESQSQIDKIDTIEKIADEIRECRNCALGSLRTNAAPGEGVLDPLVMVIGEGPGEDEDKQGRPFVGKAGQLLDKMLSSINLSRTTNTFIANVIKCRPPSNRNPQPEETSACACFLERQIQLLKPKYILVAGKVAAETLFKTNEPIGKLRGKFLELTIKNFTYPVLITYHPAALLRNEELKRPAWEDLKLLKSKLNF